MIIITGAAGFIGSALAAQLNRQGRTNLVVVDRKSDCANLQGITFESYVHADDFFDLAEDIDCDLIFHMGACSSTTESDVDYLRENNTGYSQKMFRLATEKHCPLIYASSAATYGAGELGYSDEHDLIDRIKPLNPYGDSKHLFDLWALGQRSTPPVWFGLKFFNVYGPNEYHKGEMRSIACKAHQQILETGKVRLFRSHRPDYQDGRQLRDFVYVLDAVQAMLRLARLKTGSGVYNLGTGTARSFYDLVMAVFAEMGRTPCIEYIPMPDNIRQQYQYFTRAEMDKFHRLLPDFNFRTLEEGIGDYCRNYLMRANPHLGGSHG